MALPSSFYNTFQSFLTDSLVVSSSSSSRQYTITTDPVNQRFECTCPSYLSGNCAEQHKYSDPICKHILAEIPLLNTASVSTSSPPPSSPSSSVDTILDRMFMALTTEEKKTLFQKFLEI